MQNLRKKPTFNELINYLEVEQPKIKFPDRTATFLRNSHYLSQFDGNLLDLEEQEKNFEKEKLKESEIRKIAAETQTTAALLRGNQIGGSSSSGTQTGTYRPTTKTGGTQIGGSSSSGTQTGTYRPTTTTGDAQTDPPLETGTQTERPKTPQIFNIAQDDKSDTAMEEADAAMEEADAAEQRLREQEERRNQMIKNLASKNLGEIVTDLPYLPSSSASSSNVIAKPKNVPEELPAEDTSRPRGRPPKRDKPIVISDDTENTQQKRVRKPKAEAQKRKQEENESLPPQKKQSKDVLKKIKAAMARSNKADEKQLKQIEKAVAKADEAAKKAAKEAAKEAKAKAAPEPKASPEPKRSPGRPKTQAKPEAEPQETETKSKPIPVKKNAPKKTEQKGTAKVFHDTFDEWKRNANT